MEISIHIADGESFSFVQPDEQEIQKIFTNAQPNRIFTNKQILVYGKMAVSSFNASAIEYIEFDTDKEVNWPKIQQLNEAHIVDEEEFKNIMTMLSRKYKGTRDDIGVGDEVHGAMELILRSGKKLFVGYKTTAKQGVEARQGLTHLFNQPALHFDRFPQGKIIINTEAISRYAIYPGPPTAPTNSWVATRKGESLSEMMSMEQIDTRDLFKDEEKS